MKVHSPINELQLFKQIADEDESAFRAIYDNYREELFSTAFRLTKSPLQAQEITQEVFISLWISRARLSEIEMPDAYIYRILYNKIGAYMRKESNRSRIIADALRYTTGSVNTTEEMVSDHECEKLLKQAIDQLSTQQKTVYRLNSQFGLSIDEIALQLNISPHTVKSHLGKAKEFIRNYLKDIALVTALLVSFQDATRF